jgi:hypothetical protein
VSDPGMPPAALSMTCAAEALTAWDALAWCWPAPGREVIGFGYAVDRARWFRLDAEGPRGPDGRGLSLDGMYEIVAFDADRELRWLLDTDGTPHAVVLSEGLTGVPGTAVEAISRAPHRLTPDDGPLPAHLLAEHVARPADTRAGGEWARLHSHRYDDALVPYRWPAAGDPPTGLALEYVEYVDEDEYGNLSVVETRLTGLRPYHLTQQSKAPRQETR